MWYFATHVAVVSACIALAATTSSWALWFLPLIAGHSFACIAFFAHELSHGAVLGRGHVRTAVELFAWGLNFIPATLWDEVHNHVHHCHTNTVADTDRRWMAAESHLGTRAYTTLLYPHQNTLKWNPLVFVQFLGYIARNIIAALSGGKWGLVPAPPRYTLRQRLRIMFELSFITLLQLCIVWVLGYNPVKWGAVVLGGQAVASAVVMGYVFTNHFLSPLQEENDPLAASVSVAVPKVVDRLHLHFSYHTEHHLFPAMDNRYTPLLSDKLAELFPEKYTRIPLSEAWRRLWKSQPFARHADHRPEDLDAFSEAKHLLPSQCPSNSARRSRELPSPTSRT